MCDAGTFEGSDPDIQGDNAGQHEDEKLYKYVVILCKEKNGC